MNIENREPILAGWSDDNKYGGEPFIVPELFSAGNVLKIRFVSDNSVGYSGFALTVKMMKTVNITYTFGEETVVIPTEKGKNYPLPDFEDLFTLPDGYTFVSWNLLGGYDQPGEVICPNEPLTVAAVVAKEEPGLNIDYMGDYYLNIQHEGDDELDLSDREDGISFYLYDDGGPDIYYTNYSDAYLTIIAPEGAKIRVTGSGFTAENCDFLIFFDGDKYSSVIGENNGYSGEIEIDELTSSGNTLTVFFSSDDENNEEGFCLYVSIVFDTVLLGDVNADDTVDIKDVSALLNVLAGGTAPGDCNINGDDVVDIKDVSALLNILAGN